MRPAATLAAALASLALSSLARAEPPVQAQGAAAPAADVDQPEYPRPSAHFTTMAAGVGMTALWYGAAAGVSYVFPDAPGARDLRLPVVGPWMAVANNGCPPDAPDCSGVWVVLRTLVTAIDGIGQAGGPLIVLEGILMHTETPRPPPSDGRPLLFIPLPRTVGSRAIGLGVSGAF